MKPDDFVSHKSTENLRGKCIQRSPSALNDDGIDLIEDIAGDGAGDHPIDPFKTYVAGIIILPHTINSPDPGGGAELAPQYEPKNDDGQ